MLWDSNFRCTPLLTNNSLCWYTHIRRKQTTVFLLNFNDIKVLANKPKYNTYQKNKRGCGKIFKGKYPLKQDQGHELLLVLPQLLSSTRRAPKPAESLQRVGARNQPNSLQRHLFGMISDSIRSPFVGRFRCRDPDKC